ncbi:MAG: type II toxin-antitoxin system VapC family toxin [Bauldia sp.]
MIVDTSALVAIIHYEPEAELFQKIISEAEPARLSAASYVELGVVIARGRNPRISNTLDYFLDGAGIIIEPVTEKQARIAREAYRDYGKGSGHPAGLNFGDCFAYALARDLGEPLLYKGTDFAHTDVRSALK